MDIPCFPPARPAPGDGRYHRAGDPWPLYASLDAATALSEWRGASGGALDARGERRRLWRVDVTNLPVLDLRDPQVQTLLDVDPADLTGGRAPCQALARRAHRLGAAGLVVPSAARDGDWNLVVFPGGFDRLKPTGSSVRSPLRPVR